MRVKKRPQASREGTQETGAVLLTRLEELFLLTVLRLDEPAYLVNIREHLLKHTGKEWAFGSLYVLLSKLEKNGLVRTYIGRPKGVRGGKAVKYYELTEEGIAALAKTKILQDEMWKGFPASGLKAIPHER